MKISKRYSYILKVFASKFLLLLQAPLVVFLTLYSINNTTRHLYFPLLDLFQCFGFYLWFITEYALMPSFETDALY